jgi:hypothetical protein
LRSLSIDERIYGADHPDVAIDLNNLAGLYKSQGRYSEAEPLYLRSLQICEQRLGVDHPSTVTVRQNYDLFLAQWRS